MGKRSRSRKLIVQFSPKYHNREHKLYWVLNCVGRETTVFCDVICSIVVSGRVIHHKRQRSAPPSLQNALGYQYIMAMALYT